MPTKKRVNTKVKVARKKKAVAKKKKVVKKTTKLPKTLGTLVDQLWKKDQAIKELNATLAILKSERQELENHAFQMFKNEDMEGGRGKLAQVSISRSVVPQIESPERWDDLFKWIRKRNDFSVMQRRLAVTHIRQLWDDKVEVPGVVPFTKVGLSVTKLKK